MSNESDKSKDFGEARRAVYQKIKANHTGTVHEATSLAVQQVRALKDFEKMVSELVDQAIREECQAWYYQSNATLRHRAATGAKERKPKRDPAAPAGSTDAAGKVIREMMRYTLLNRPVGNLTGLELDLAVEKETARARGHTKNARLAAALREHTKDEQTVAKAIDDATYREIFNSIFGPPRNKTKRAKVGAA